MTGRVDAIAVNLVQFRAQLREREVPYQALLHLQLWRPLKDIFIDLATVLLCAVAVVELSPWLIPAALTAIGNRQRALGNVLHDGGHRNIHRSRWINDGLMRLLVAPLLFASLSRYRELHFRHHLELGDAQHDPDFLCPLPNRRVGWGENLLRQLFSPRTWWGSLTGHLARRDTPVLARLYIVAWWLSLAAGLTLVCDAAFALTLCALWIVARATVFHGITVFREMCDHFGLPTGHVVSFTRDMVSHGVWSRLIHPRNNGYHLTHHLMPAIPYYRLPEAQQLFAGLPMYRQYDRTYSSYLFGPCAIAASWRTGAIA